MTGDLKFDKDGEVDRIVGIVSSCKWKIYRSKINNENNSRNPNKIYKVSRQLYK